MERALGHVQYLEETNRAISMLKDDKIKILKADIFNEITLRHPIPGGILLNLKRDPTTMELYAIDCDQEKIDIALYMQMYEFVKVTKGDICLLPYESNCFDLALDFSTLDHIHPEKLGQALAQYHRVLKNKGLFVLFVWCADIYKCDGEDQRDFEKQYYFSAENLKKEFRQCFDILEEEKGCAYPYKDIHIFMYRFLGRKK